MNSAKKEEEGHNLMAEAEKLHSSSKSGGFFRSLFGSSSNQEEAAETFVRAANSFKLAKSWTQAGKAFEKAAAVYGEIKDMEYESASKYSDAGKAYKNVNPTKAIPCFEKAINLYADSARFQQCARLQKDLAEMYESDVSTSSADYEKVIAAYTSAADFYDMDDAKSNANTMRLKVASLNALAENYTEAIQMFEDVAQASLANNLLKYGAREHLLRAGLCRLCLGDVIGAERAVQSYANMDSSFPSSREGRLLSDVVESVSSSDEQSFTNHVFEYDSISKLDEWKTTILLRIKNQIKADEGEEDLT